MWLVAQRRQRRQDDQCGSQLRRSSRRPRDSRLRTPAVAQSAVQRRWPCCRTEGSDEIHAAGCALQSVRVPATHSNYHAQRDGAAAAVAAVVSAAIATAQSGQWATPIGSSATQLLALTPQPGRRISAIPAQPLASDQKHPQPMRQQAHLACCNRAAGLDARPATGDSAPVPALAESHPAARLRDEAESQRARAHSPRTAAVVLRRLLRLILHHGADGRTHGGGGRQCSRQHWARRVAAIVAHDRQSVAATAAGQQSA